MFAFLRNLFPDRIFRRKLEPAAERRLGLAQARAEEAIIRAHVDNALMFVDTLAEDMTFDRAIDSYIREMAIPEPLASTVATRTLVVLGQDLVPYRRRALESARRRRGPPAASVSTTPHKAARRSSERSSELSLRNCQSNCNCFDAEARRTQRRRGRPQSAEVRRATSQDVFVKAARDALDVATRPPCHSVASRAAVPKNPAR